MMNGGGPIATRLVRLSLAIVVSPVYLIILVIVVRTFRCDKMAKLVQNDKIGQIVKLVGRKSKTLKTAWPEIDSVVKRYIPDAR